ncbi:sigma-70 family RNA polymerase sigma factor [Timonella senegalensis]|uniref:sigma-70 family RNA polymerase sigma factor n=1 Tax=Timonella senegalensis TaxID=1465825 RepID=UPI002FE33CF5
MAEHSTTSTSSSLPDTDLIEALRSGDESAYSILWERHYPAAVRAARAMTSTHEPEDLAQEAFTRIYQSLLNGKGPTEAFRAYLYTTLKSVSIAWSGKVASTVDITTQEHELISEEDLASLTEDKAFTARAFKNLPTDWRTVLWYTEVEGMTPAEVAPLMGLSARAVSALAFRAREGLRSSWLQAHVSGGTDRPTQECEWTENNLAAYARDSLSARRTERIQAHLNECTRCSLMFIELQEVESSLRGILLPLLLGVAPASLWAVGGTGTAAVGATSLTGALTQIPGRIRNWAAANTGTAAVAGASGAMAVALAVTAAVALNDSEPTPPPAATGPSAPAAVGAPGSGSATQPAPTDADSPESDEPSETTTPINPPTAQVPSAGPLPSTSAPQPPPVTPSPTQTPDVAPPNKFPTLPPIKPVVPLPPLPTVDPTPTEEPTEEPTGEPTVDPTPTDEPTDEPTEEPTVPPADLVVADFSTEPSYWFPQLSGTATPGSTIQLVDVSGSTTRSTFTAEPDAQLASPAGKVLGSVVTGQDGAWTLSVSAEVLTSGVRSYQIQQLVDGEFKDATSFSFEYMTPDSAFPISNLVECYKSGNSWNLVSNWYDITPDVPLRTTNRDITLCVYFEIPSGSNGQGNMPFEYVDLEANGVVMREELRISARLKRAYIVWETNTGTLNDLNSLRLRALVGPQSDQPADWTSPFTFGYVETSG